MRSPLPDRHGGDPEPYGSPAEAAGDLNVSLLGALPPSAHLKSPLTLSQLMDPGTAYDAIVDRIELLSGQMPVRLLGCVGIKKDLLRYRLAANLARRLARDGRTVTIVEADLGRSVLAAEPEQRDGLMDMLLYGCSYPAVARPSGIPGLKVVTAGSHPWSGEPIHGDEWERVLGAFRSHSDVTLLTATTAIPAPVLSLLARRLDWILIACALDAGSRHEIRVGYLTLWDMDAPILGLVAERSASEGTPEPEAGEQAPELREETAGSDFGEIGSAVKAELGEAAGGREGDFSFGSAGPETGPARKAWDQVVAVDVPGLDEDAEVVIREAHTVDADAASLWQEEVSRLRAPAAPPSGSAPFAGMEMAAPPEADSGPGVEPGLQAAPEEASPQIEETWPAKGDEPAWEGAPRPPSDARLAWGDAPPPPGDAPPAWGDAPPPPLLEPPVETHESFEGAWGEMERAGRLEAGGIAEPFAPMTEPIPGEGDTSAGEDNAQDSVDWPAMVAPVFPADAPRDEVVNAIDELEEELVGRGWSDAPPRAPITDTGRGHERKPWRVLVPGAAIGVIALLFWAYHNEVIQFERRPPRGPETAPPVLNEGPAAGSEGPVLPSSSPPSTEPATPEPASSKPAAAMPGVTTPDVTPPAGSASSEPSTPVTGYGVHVSSFQTLAKANEDLDRYREVGYRGLVVTVQVPGKGRWRRVMLGPYPTLEEARSVAQAIREDSISPEAEAMKLEP